jgi:CheY-like chemotaxis protein
MAGLDGNYFIQMLRAQGNQIPATAISAAVFPQEQQAALAAGYDRFLKNRLT